MYMVCAECCVFVLNVVLCLKLIVQFMSGDNLFVVEHLSLVYTGDGYGFV